MSNVLDYRNSYFYVKNSSINRLRIEVDSRIKLTAPAEEYYLLAPHPREQTFLDNGAIYSGMLAAEQGASEIIFIIDQPNRKAITSRRYDVPGQPANYRRDVGASPYTGDLHTPPQEVQATEIFDFAGIMTANDLNQKLVATVQFNMYGREIFIEFPVRVLNINPLTATEAVPEGKQWQIASPMVPVFIESSDPNQRIRPGYIAFGRLGYGVTISMVYLVDVYTPRSSQDYSATVNQQARVRLFSVP